MTNAYTNYDEQANNFAKLPDYSIHCGTDYLALREIPTLIAQHPSVHTILDLGCGSGLATRFLKKHFPQALVVGADINQTMLAAAVRSDPHGLYVPVHQTNEQMIYPFLPDSFDVITCSFVMHEHKTLHALQQFVSQIANMLKPGGLLLAWDVHQALFQGEWLSIKIVSPLQGCIQDGEKYTVTILPADAEVTGTYWSAETISKLASACHLQTVQMNYPLADKNDDVTWLDETRLAPYFVLQAQKEKA